MWVQCRCELILKSAGAPGPRLRFQSRHRLFWTGLDGEGQVWGGGDQLEPHRVSSDLILSQAVLHRFTCTGELSFRSTVVYHIVTCIFLTCFYIYHLKACLLLPLCESRPCINRFTARLSLLFHFLTLPLGVFASKLYRIFNSTLLPCDSPFYHYL